MSRLATLLTLLSLWRKGLVRSVRGGWRATEAGIARVRVEEIRR